MQCPNGREITRVPLRTEPGVGKNVGMKTSNLVSSFIFNALVWEFGGAEGNRTPDLVIANDALSQLSYGPEPWEYGAASNVREGPIWEAAYYGFAGPTVNRPAGERDWPRRGPRAKLGEPPRKGPGSCRH